MPRVVETTVYEFDELTEQAKEAARDWYRQGALDYDWWDCIFDDAKAIGALMGIDIDDIAFELHSQGAGACFSGRYRYKRGATKAVADYTGNSDPELIRIAKALQAEQRGAFYRLSAGISGPGRSCHKYAVRIEVEHDNDCLTDSQSEAISELLRDFMDWIYKQLQQEYDYQMSDACCDETIRANEYTFTETGRREG